LLKSNKEDILELNAGLENIMHIGLLPQKLKVGVIGAGRASLIKTKAFLSAGAQVEVLSPKFDKEFKKLNNQFLVLKKGKFKKNFLQNKHIIVIAVSDMSLQKRIIRHCKRLNKLYLVCSDYRFGNVRLCFQESNDEIIFSLSTKRGNPKLSKYLSQKAMNFLNTYATFSIWVTNLRESLKNHQKKDEILDFVCSDDFFFFFRKGYANKILKLFYEV